VLRILCFELPQEKYAQVSLLVVFTRWLLSNSCFLHGTNSWTFKHQNFIHRTLSLLRKGRTFKNCHKNTKTQKLTKMNITELALVEFSDFVLWWQKPHFGMALH
jgi:hypothetical protein